MVNRRVAAVHLWALPLESVFEDGDVRGVREELRGQRVLACVDDEARRRGIRAGMKESEGKARDQALVVRWRDPNLEQARLENAAELLFTFGPEVEVAAPGFLFVEIGKSRRAIAKRLKIRGELDDRTIAEAIVKVMSKAGHRVSVAVAKDPDTARTFAEHVTRVRELPKKRQKTERPPIAIVATGEEVAALARLPLRALTWTDIRVDPDRVVHERMLGALGSLSLLGIKDVGRFQSLPPAQVSSRFGDAGATLVARATGAAERPLRRFKPPERLVETFDLDAATEDLEPILFVLRRLFSRLEARLFARMRSVRALSMSFVVEPGLTHGIAADAPRKRSSKRTEIVVLKFARATRRASTMLSLARERLGASLPGAVCAVTIEACAPESDHGAQLDLFTSHAKRIEEVSELIGRLQAALGDDAIASFSMHDTHRPESAWKLVPFDIEAALAEAPVEKPKVSLAAQLAAPLAKQSGHLTSLPAVDESLAVTSIPEKIDEAPLDVDAKPAWPKPIARKPEDEPLPELPPRPLELLSAPERVTLLKQEHGVEQGVVLWRGRRYPLVSLGATERLEAEWWTTAPLARDYWVAEVADGRRFWLYAEPTGGVYLHGIFD